LPLSAKIRPLEFVDGTRVRTRGKILLYFGGCDYLGLGRDPRVLAAMRKACGLSMAQPGASRATTGEHSLYLEAERALARFFQFPQAALLASGYLATLAAVQALRPRATHILLEKGAHSCSQDAAAASGLRVLAFQPGDPAHLASALRKLPRTGRPLILADGTRGIRGGFPQLDEYLKLLPPAGWLAVDDAHGVGAVGPYGRGVLAVFKLKDPRILLSISLAKGLGVGGGAVLGSAEMIGELKLHSRVFVGSTTVPLMIPAGLIASLRVLRADDGRVAQLQQNAASLHELLPQTGEIFGDPRTPVTGIFPRTAARAEKLRRALLRADIHPIFIRYVSGPDAGFFRFAVNAQHTPEEIERLAAAVRSGLSS